jgi:hypothetical protein
VEADSDGGRADAAIREREIEEVLEARMQEGDTTVDSCEKIFCFKGRFSETACVSQQQRGTISTNRPRC